jgi:hypothetical protein
MIEGRGNTRIEAARLMVREQSGLKQAAVTAYVSQTGKELGIGVAAGG